MVNPDYQFTKKRKGELASLGEWTHINCMVASARSKIHDEILCKLIKPPKATEEADTAAKTRAEKVLEDFDSQFLFDDEIPDDDQGVDMSEIPGGWITYLFEKRSDSSL